MVEEPAIAVCHATCWWTVSDAFLRYSAVVQKAHARCSPAYAEEPFDLCVSRNGSVGPSQRPTTAFTQSHTGAKERTEGSFTARSRPWNTACEPFYWDVADHSLDPERSYAVRERTMRLKKAIRRLPNALRTVVEIRQEDNFSMREMAEIAGISVPAVKS